MRRGAASGARVKVNGGLPAPILNSTSGNIDSKVRANNTEIDGLGCYPVNFAFVAFSREHLLIRPEVHSSTGRCTTMIDITINSDLFVDGFALGPPLSQRSRTASPSTRTPKFSCPTIPRRTLRGRKE